jgi:hypothetical protein
MAQAAVEGERSIYDQVAEYVACVNNPLYWFEHYVKILDSTHQKIVSYEMWPHLVQFIRDLHTYDELIALKSKQVGVSWTLAGVAVHDCYSDGANIPMLSRGKQEASDLLFKAHFIWEQLPPFLKLKLLHEDTFFLQFEKTYGKIRALPSTEEAGIGLTASRAILDEHEYHEFAKENHGHIRPTIDAGAKLDIVSTADPTRIDSNFKTLWREARAGNNNLHPIFMPATVRPGRDSEELERIRAGYYLDWQYRANYPMTEEEALSPIAGRSFFDRDVLRALLESCSEPKEVRQGVVNLYHGPRVGVHYVCGLDASEGAGGDYQVLWLEGQDGLQREMVAVIHTNQIRTDTFAYMAFQLLSDYYKPMVVAGADAYCKQVLESLIALGYPLDKIHRSGKDKKILGYVESTKTQEESLLELDKSLRAGLKCRFKPAVLELFSYQLKDKGNNRIAPAEGAHNDLVMAMAKCNIGFKTYKPEIPIDTERFY